MGDNQKLTWVFEKTYDEWIDFFAGVGEPSYRAGQICAWIWRRWIFDPGAMTDFGKNLRLELGRSLDFSPPEVLREAKSKDGTRKYLIKTRDGAQIETALIKRGDRTTACLSTQAGCPIDCPFCATGGAGFERNLSAGEIASQFAVMEKILGKEIDNVVLMGMGEPFLNVTEVLRAVGILNHPKMRELGARRVTISTAGIIPGIEALAASGLAVGLAVSLHAANDELRDELVPCNTSYPLKELMASLIDFQKRTGDRVTIEYALFKKKNDSLKHARQLVRLLHGLHAYINLIPANGNRGGYERSAPEDILRFQSVLKSAGFESEIRAEHGGDIMAACGQLKGRLSER
ncbi:MAG: 23S rRNA (adenine(2503)-C(2))-methyltransferase RlmN [Synergistaceae bacterium]|nr:23S rRNA (adenine(2503)-C(2))-methyltransferase RlmN [Synergistaceae bacterium]